MIWAETTVIFSYRIFSNGVLRAKLKYSFRFFFRVSVMFYRLLLKQLPFIPTKLLLVFLRYLEWRISARHLMISLSILAFLYLS